MTVDENILRKAFELENIGLKALDALHLACAEKAAEIMLTTDDEIVKKVMANGGYRKWKLKQSAK